MDRRTFVKSGTALSGLAAFGAFDQARAQGTGPIRIGLLTPLTGVVASGGKEIAEGFNLYWDQVGRKIGNRSNARHALDLSVHEIQGHGFTAKPGGAISRTIRSGLGLHRKRGGQRCRQHDGAHRAGPTFLRFW